MNFRVPNALEYDAFLFEAPATLYAAPLICRRNPDVTLLYLDTNWRSVGVSAYNLNSLSPVKRAVRYADRTIDAKILEFILRRYIDGAMTVSEMMRDHLRTITDFPIEIARPYVTQETYETLSKVTPNYGSRVALTLSTSRGHKGVDQLVSAWKRVRTEFPDSRLEIVGKGHPSEYESVDGISVHGYVDNLSDVFSRSSLYVHPARFDASPVSTLESLCAGLPPLVTTRTGTKSEVRRISSLLIIEPTSDSIADGIIEYFRTKTSRRRRFAENARSIGAEFAENRREEEFETQFFELLEQVDEHSQ